VVQLALGINTRMETPSTRLVVYTTLMTLGLVIALLDIASLMLLGWALVMVAKAASSQNPNGRMRDTYLTMAVLSAASWVVFVFSDLHDGVAFVQRSDPSWFRGALVGAWLLVIVVEFRRWQKNRSLGR